MKYFLIGFLLTYFAVAFVFPSYRVWKRTNVSPVIFGGADNAHDYIGKLFKIVMIGLTVTVIIYAFGSSIYSFLLPVFWLEYQTAAGGMTTYIFDGF